MPTTPLLRLGCRDRTGDSAVATWQATLARLGYPPGAIDGIFGIRTYAATRWLQRDAGVTVDGVVGAITRGAADAMDNRDTTPPEPVLWDGVDVSYAQPHVDWRAVKAADKAFVYIKASQRKVDVMLASHWRGAGDVSIRRGPYHYFDSTKPVAEQVDVFLVAVRAVGGVMELPPALDVEEAGQHETPEALVARMLAWLEPVEAELGVVPLIYTSIGFSPRYLCPTARRLSRYGLWVADWGTEAHPRPAPRVPEPWTRWVLWQREVGHCPGVAGDCDLNVMRADALELAPKSEAG